MNLSEKMRGLKEAKEAILAAKNIVIASHINPDGDSIGSLLSLGLGLEKLDKRVEMISVDGVPKRYRNLAGAQQIVKKTTTVPDLAIAVDCGKKELLGETFAVFKRAQYILEIDHHEFREPFGNIHIVDHHAAAVGELVYLLLRELNIIINKDIAQSILTSIVVETNSFQLPNIKPATFQICAQLLKTGIDFSKLSEMMYWSKTKEAVMLTGFCLSRVRFVSAGKIVWSILKREDLAKIKAKQEDADSVAAEMLAIKNVAVSIFFREKNKTQLRVSLRSKDKVNIAVLAHQYGGGGHFDAAGCIIPNKKEKVKQFLKDAEKLLR